jgi:siderophore synthetase component
MSTTAPTGLPTAGHAVAHTLLNCLLREVCGPEHRTAVTDGHLLLRLPATGTLLRVALRRTSLTGAHRFTGPVFEERHGGWTELGRERLAMRVHAELTARTGVANDEFLEQLASSHEGVEAALDRPAAPPDDGYLESEQALVFGHRFHPTPKARTGGRDAWTAYAPEARAAFPLRHLAVRAGLLAQDSSEPWAPDALDRLRPVPDGYRLLPAHPWQYELLSGHPRLRAALAAGDILDLGTGGALYTPTSSVRTLYGDGMFLKFSLNVRITNCLRKNAAYELTGAVALTRALAPVLERLAGRFPGHAVLREPAYRSAGLGNDLLEGLGVIVREGPARHLPAGVTPLLAAAVADEYPTCSAHISRLLEGAGPQAALQWWSAYLRLVVPPVLAAYFDHGVVLEPHLQNVLIGVDTDGFPVRVLFRDLEGAKLLPERHAGLLASLPADVARPMTYDARRGWDRVVYCLFVNHLAELAAAIADLHPHLEPALWGRVHRTLREYAAENGCPPALRALLDGAPLPAKANLLTRWRRQADRSSGYVPIPSPLSWQDA